MKIAWSFARIHKANLCNFGILPLALLNPADYCDFKTGPKIALHKNVCASLIRRPIMKGLNGRARLGSV